MEFQRLRYSLASSCDAKGDTTDGKITAIEMGRTGLQEQTPKQSATVLAGKVIEAFIVEAQKSDAREEKKQNRPSLRS
jgi:uncharacterized protein (UPF0262 family)